MFGFVHYLGWHVLKIPSVILVDRDEDVWKRFVWHGNRAWRFEFSQPCVLLKHGRIRDSYSPNKWEPLYPRNIDLWDHLPEK